jgi:threonine/homoserine/homoserine lactone efflux protein
MLSALATGLLLGAVAGLAPGPLMTLVIAHSLRHGAREGCKIAVAPLLTDAPIILAALLVAGRIAEAKPLLGLLCLAGGAFVLYLAVETFRAQPPTIEKLSPPQRSWLKGVLVNLLSPHPWLFWSTVGVVTLTRTLSVSWWAAASFLGTFYLLLVGTKIGLALLADRSRHFLTQTTYRVILRSLAVALAVFAFLLLFEGWSTVCLPSDATSHLTNRRDELHESLTCRIPAESGTRGTRPSESGGL